MRNNMRSALSRLRLFKRLLRRRLLCRSERDVHVLACVAVVQAEAVLRGYGVSVLGVLELLGEGVAHVLQVWARESNVRGEGRRRQTGRRLSKSPIERE